MERQQQRELLALKGKMNYMRDFEQAEFICDLHKYYLESSTDNRKSFHKGRLCMVLTQGRPSSNALRIFALRGAKQLHATGVKKYHAPKSEIEVLDQIYDFMDPDNSNRNFDINNLIFLLNEFKEEKNIEFMKNIGPGINLKEYYEVTLTNRIKYINEDSMTTDFVGNHNRLEEIKKLKDHIENQSRAAKDCSTEKSDVDVIKNYISDNPNAKECLRSLLNLSVGLIADESGNMSSIDRSELVKIVISTLEEQHGVSLENDDSRAKSNTPKPQM